VTDENAPVGMCVIPVTGPKAVKNRVHLHLTSSVADRDQEIDRLLALGARRADIGQTGAESWTVLSWPIPRETSSASCARRKRSPDEAHTENRRRPCPRQKSAFAMYELCQPGDRDLIQRKPATKNRT
jgi:hypothetical protein